MGFVLLNLFLPTQNQYRSRASRIIQFNYEIVHRLGQTNVANYYSRHPIKPTRNEFLEEFKSAAKPSTNSN